MEAALRKINATVAAIAQETKRTVLIDHFRMPHGNGDTELVASQRNSAQDGGAM